MAGKVVRLAESVTCHAWNSDQSLLAYSANDSEVLVVDGKDCKTVKHTLDEHDPALKVTAVDWGYKTNRIVTCSQDRNAYVWTLQKDGSWKPVLVILRINRAATKVKWSSQENKFAVSSGAKLVSVCYFEEDNDWWVSKHIKKNIKSTVLDVAWHPNNILIATASCDFKARVFAAAIKGVDKKPVDTAFGDIKKTPFGDCLWEVEAASGWVHSIAWSPNGNQLGWTAHDSTTSFADFSQSATPAICAVKGKSLPFRDCLFLTENSFVAVGHDLNPTLFQNDGKGTWTEVAQLDQKADAKKAAGAGNRAAFDMFKNKVDLGSDTAGADRNLDTKHQNSIVSIQAYKRSGDNVTEFTTVGMDGNIVFWSCKTLEGAIAGLKFK